MLAPLPQHIDATMLVCFRQCPQKFYNEFCRGFRPPGLSVDLHAGACFSLAVETVWNSYVSGKTHPDDYLSDGLIAFTKAWGEFTIPDHKKTTKTFERVWAAVDDYFTVYNPETDHVRPHTRADGTAATEFTFAIPLDFPGFPRHPETGEPFIYCGRFDLLGDLMGTGLVPLDNKTTGRTPSDFSGQFDLRSQFIGYRWASKQLGYPAKGVVARGTVILMKEIRQLEAIKPYSDYIEELWFEQLRRDLHRLVEMWTSGRFDYDLGEACTAYGLCIFREACTSPAPDDWLSQFEVRKWNPLHRDPTEELNV